MGDVTTGDSELAKKNTRIYSLQLREYANQILSPAELNTYLVLFDTIKDAHGFIKPEDLMMLDIAVFDFMRIKRLHRYVQEKGDMSESQAKDGRVFTRVNEASYLLNAVENQFRQNMKELLLTQKEQTKKALMLGEKDLATWIKDTVIDVPSEDVKSEAIDEVKKEDDGVQDSNNTAM